MRESTAEKLGSLISDIFTLVGFFEQGDKSFNEDTLRDLFDESLECFVKLPPDENSWSVIDAALSANFRDDVADPSDLRYLVLNILAIFFKFYSRVAAPYDRTYHAVREWRGGKRDAAFIQENLLELVLSGQHKKMSFPVREYFLKLLGLFMNRFGGQNPVFDNITMGEMTLISPQLQLFGLYRRYIELPNRHLEEHSFEATAKESGYFRDLAAKGKFYRHVLSNMGYLKRESVLARIAGYIWTGVSRTLPLFFNTRYLAYHVRTRFFVYIFMAFWILVVVALTWGHMVLWRNLNHDLLQEIRQVVSG